MKNTSTQTPYKIVVLDGIYANPGDLSWEALEEFGEVTIYDRSTPDEVVERSKAADILVINKIKLGVPELRQLPKLKLIAVAATGTDNVDLSAAKEREIVVKNAVGYSTDAVAQHVFALLFALTNTVHAYKASVDQGAWNADTGFSYTLASIPEIAGKILGIYGFGAIGQRVAELGRAFGMQICVASKHAQQEDYPSYRMRSLEHLFAECDVISLHAPLRATNERIINAELFRKMKPEAFLINTARGKLIDEQDLCEALRAGTLSGAALDVLSQEPPPADHPLLGLPNCLITPHIAWASKEARTRLLQAVTENIKAFLSAVE